MKQPKKNVSRGLSEECELYAPETKHSGGMPFDPVELAIIVVL